ncbi:MAG TPA: hypothetical protein VGI43_18675 [Mucilaginibacter sp.]|jgi:hypothetical protein
MNPFLLIFSIISLFISKQKNAQADSVTAKVDGVTYHAVLNDDESISIKTSIGKTVLHLRKNELHLDYEAFGKFEFVDFNGDGYKDLYIEYLSNIPDRGDLILYDKRSKSFIKVKDFPDYPESIRIPNTNVYYSYHRSGCADSDWDSDLYKITNYKIVKIGNISGRDCGDDEKQGVFIYKINGHNERMVETRSIQALNGFKDTKWGFLAIYWKNNYKKF